MILILGKIDKLLLLSRYRISQKYCLSVKVALVDLEYVYIILMVLPSLGEIIRVPPLPLIKTIIECVAIIDKQMDSDEKFRTLLRNTVHRINIM